MKNYKYLLLFLLAILIFIPTESRADTFGYESAGSSESPIAYVYSLKYYSLRISAPPSSPENNGTLDNIKFYAHSKTERAYSVDITGFVNEKDSVDTNSHGEIASSEILNETISMTKTLYTHEFSSEEIYSGVDYIINVLGNGSDVNDYTNGEGVYIYFDWAESYYSEGKTGSSGYSNNKENPWTDSISSGQKYSIYATYTPSGGEEEAPAPQYQDIIWF